MSKASRRSSRTTRGAAGRPISSGSSSGSPTGSPGNPSAAQPAGPTVAADSLGGRAPVARAASTLGAGTRPSGRTAGSSRPRRQLYQPSFLERHRTALLGGGLLVIVAIVGAFFFFSVTASAYACTTITQPAPAGTPLPNGSPAPLGQAQPDMGNMHVTVGVNQRYAYCPPASGPHYNSKDEGPIPAKYYGPDDGARPEGWIHNLEHGAVVILYNCKMGACTDSNAATLQGLTQNFPNSPICGVRAGVLSPVIARFDDMAAPFAALVWDRVLYLNTLDTAAILEFYQSEAEQTNPEPQCARPSPSAAPSAAAPSGSETPSGSASPSSSAGPSSTPGGSPSGAPSVAPSSSPSPTPLPSSS